MAGVGETTCSAKWRKDLHHHNPPPPKRVPINHWYYCITVCVCVCVGGGGGKAMTATQYEIYLKFLQLHMYMTHNVNGSQVPNSLFLVLLADTCELKPSPEQFVSSITTCSQLIQVTGY